MERTARERRSQSVSCDSSLSADQLSERGKALLGRSIDPVQILHDDDQRVLPATPQEHLPQGLDEADLRYVRTERDQVVGFRFYTKNVDEVRCMLEQVEASVEQGSASFLRHRRRVIGLGDPAEGLQHVENGQIGNRGAV